MGNTKISLIKLKSKFFVYWKRFSSKTSQHQNDFRCNNDISKVYAVSKIVFVCTWENTLETLQVVGRLCHVWVYNEI